MKIHHNVCVEGMEVAFERNHFCVFQLGLIPVQVSAIRGVPVHAVDAIGVDHWYNAKHRIFQ